MAIRPLARDRCRAWVRRLRSVFRRDVFDSHISAELAFHLDMETEKNVRAGMDPTAARRTAAMAFGGVDRFAEEIRDVRNITWVEEAVHDLRHAARALRRSPEFALSAITALALGIGANTAVFSVVHAVVIARLPYADPERLVRVWEANPSQRIQRGSVSPGVLDLAQRSRTLEYIALFGERNMLFSDAAEPWESRAAAVSPEFFDLLGVRPILGRAFVPIGSRDVASVSQDEIVISHALWLKRFGGDSSVIGRSLRMDYRWPYTIVGVMPPGFAFPPRAEFWTLLSYGPPVTAAARQFRYYGAIARIRQGFTADQAAHEATGIAAQLATEFPAANAGWTVMLSPLDRSIVGDTRPTLLVLLGLATCVLLIACANVTTLAVARATTRRHETAVRIALGAGTHRLARQWATEALLLAVLGGAGGLLVGYWSNRLLLAVAPRDIPRLDEVTFGGAVVVFVVLTTAAVALLVGVVPALRARDAQPLDAMRSRTTAGGSGSARLRMWLVGSQMALTFVLTVASTLLLRSFDRLQNTELGFRRHDVLSAELRVPGGRFSVPRPWFRRAKYFDRLIAEVGQIPGVRAVAGTSKIPLTGEAGPASMWRTDAPGAHGTMPPTSAADQWKAAIQLITPPYFEAMGIPLMRGRAFTPRDRFAEDVLTNDTLPRPPGVAIINEAMARRYWPDSDPLGTTIFLLDDKPFAAYRTVVGIVGDVRAESVDSAAAPTVFLPYAQNPGQSLSLVLRSDLPPDRLVGPVRSRLRSFDPAITIASLRPFDDVFGGAVSRPRFTMLLAGGFATLALVIAGVGVFGIVGFLVARRTQELGIRIALGATPADVLWMVLAEGLRPVLFGMLTGAAGAVVVAGAMRALLYGIAPLDGASFTAAAAVLGIASLAAAAVPARRAAGVDPLRSLRRD